MVATIMSGVGPHMDAEGLVALETRRKVLNRSVMIALIAFLSLIDLFGSQALLPTLMVHYDVSASSMGFAVNASAIGMAVASLVVAVFARRIDRKRGIWLCLVLLSLPTFLLAQLPDLGTFTLLRILQGVAMAGAFTLTLTYLSEQCRITAVAGAMAAYITGNVASNLFGRLLASGLANDFGLAESFYGFGILNLVGAAVAFFYIGSSSGKTYQASEGGMSVYAAWMDHLTNRHLVPVFGIGFLLLFVFVATFTYANFILSAAPFSLSQTEIGLVYFIFVPAIITTPLAASAFRKYGSRASFQFGIVVSMAGLGLTLTTNLALFMLGLTLIGAGLFFAQSIATSYIGRTATHDQASANGLYLACYYFGGISGAWLMGLLFESTNWATTVYVLLAFTASAGLLSLWMARADTC